jgi:hypothetical protein
MTSWENIPQFFLEDTCIVKPKHGMGVFGADHHDITEILLKVALNTIKQTKQKQTI